MKLWTAIKKTFTGLTYLYNYKNTHANTYTHSCSFQTHVHTYVSQSGY